MVEAPTTGSGGAAPAARRAPQQARARERLARILDATRSVLEACPAGEVVTMEAIAAAAGVPVGSLYQYFGSKTALLAAVGETVMQEGDAETERQLRACLALPWHEAVDRVVAAALAFMRQTPHYRQVLRSIRYTAEFAQITSASNERVARVLSQHPAFARAGISPEKTLEICRITITAVNALQDRVLAQESPDLDAWADETKRLIKGYLGTHVA